MVNKAYHKLIVKYVRRFVFFNAKFHYAILIADLQRAGIWPIEHYPAH